jgi:hypothetical protein
MQEGKLKPLSISLRQTFASKGFESWFTNYFCPLNLIFEMTHLSNGSG